MWRVVGLWTLAGLLACTAQTEDTGPFDTSPTAPSSLSNGATTASSAGTDGDSATSTSGLGSGSGDASSGGADDTAGASGATTSACMGVPTGDYPIGMPCIEGCECASGICYSLPLVGNACSECLTDAECQNGGPGTCSVDPTTEAASCTMGEQGVMCQPDANGCAPGLVCAQIVDTHGLLPDTFCSECASDADCGAGQVCVPEVILEGTPAGYLHCIAAGSAPDGSLCPVAPDGIGNAAGCASGICAVVDVGGLGVADIGVCGPCASDADCAGGTCQPPVVDETGATPSQCV